MQNTAFFGSLDPHRRDLCAAVLALCAPDFEEKPAPAPEFLSALYQKLCAQMFPDGLPEIPTLTADEMAYLTALEAALANRRDGFDPYLDRLPLPEGALAGSRVEAQYARFEQAVRERHLLAVMRLGMEATPFDPASHTIGVHNIALHTAILAKKAGFPVDLPLVSAAALGHDIGKFGCRPGERVPYLHYYYTDLWFRRRRLTDIGHVAANHSVWDLEPDYLSVESLLLIYADFRVKQSVGPDGREITRISSLSEAFDVILSKLDAVDDAKRQRYMRVYARLRDFEQFMADKGVDVTLQGHDTPPRPQKQTALMTDEEALHALTMQCVGHNMELMSRLTGQRSFAQLLELARGETNWRRLRAYLGVFESYSLYLHIPQKVQTLAFLYELLVHR